MIRSWTIPVPGAVEHLALAEAPRPPLGARQVRVAVRACSLNYRDLSVVRGAYGRGGTRPNLIPLSDGAGEVLEVGAEVTRFHPGDRVAAIFMQRWIAGGITAAAGASALGGAIDGMLAEEVVLDEDGLVAIPNHLSFAEAACLPRAAVTAWHALIEHASLKPGETLLVQGSGGVSIFALQFARSIQSVRVGGSISLIGVLTAGATIDPTPLMRRSIRLGGIYVGSRAMFEAMNAAISANQLRPLIDATFPFDRAPDAYRHLIAANHMGKVVITIA